MNYLVKYLDKKTTSSFLLTKTIVVGNALPTLGSLDLPGIIGQDPLKIIGAPEQKSDRRFNKVSAWVIIGQFSTGFRPSDHRTRSDFSVLDTPVDTDNRDLGGNFTAEQKYREGGQKLINSSRAV